MRANKSHRTGRRGSVLLSALVLVVVMASMLVAIESRSFTSVAVLARLEAANMREIDEMSIRERLRRPLAAAMLARDGAGELPLDGTAWSLDHRGRRWYVRLQATSGLVDLYLAPPVVLSLLPDEIGAGRDAALSGLPQGFRFVAPEQTLARFGLDAEARRRILPLVTQTSPAGRLSAAHAPESLRTGAAVLPAWAQSTSQVDRVRVVLELD